MLLIKNLDLPRKGEFLRIEITDDGMIWLDNNDEWVLLDVNALEVPERMIDTNELYNKILDLQ